MQSSNSEPFSYCNAVLNFAPHCKQFQLSPPCTNPHTLQTKPFTGSRIFEISAKMHSSLSSTSNSAEHSGQVVLAALASILWFRFDKNSLWGELNIQKRELCVKGILAQDLGFVWEPFQWGFEGFSG
jgi:hypothetical protein